MSIPASHARSFLFVPADRPDRFDKALSSGADAVILDLEDAVAIDRKDDARANAAAWLSAQRPALVRINPQDTAWYHRDIELVRLPGLLGVVVPKAAMLDAALVHICADENKSIIPLVESADGFNLLAELARTPGVTRLAFGHLDFQVDLGIEGDGDALNYFRSRLVLESRLADLAPPIEGVTVEVSDTALLETETLRAKRFGFAGKLCIHPRQVDTVNRTFAPSAEDLQWARHVIAAAESAHAGVLAVDGKMVDRPVILKATRLLARAKALGCADGYQVHSGARR